MLWRLQFGLVAWDSRGVDTPPRRARKSIDCGRSKSSSHVRQRLLGHSGGNFEARNHGLVSPGDAKPDEAAALMRTAADEEDAIEKLPVTPGPILPAREQLGSLLLEQNHPALALKAFQTALANAPGRRGALHGLARASEPSAQK